MIFKQYGKTGKQVSAVGFGGMRFNMECSQEENADLIRYAYDQGINYFDTAPGYCRDQSEEIFGKAFSEMHGAYYVSTKMMPSETVTADRMREIVQRSLDRLHVPKIHFFHVWCLRKMEHYQLAMRPGGMYEGLLQCKEEGLIEHIVFSSHQPGAEIKQIVDEGMFEGVLLGTNILNFPYRWDGLQAAYEQGLGVVAMNPLAGGLIPQHEERLGFLAGEGETPTEAALRFVIALPQITVALNGFSTREHIDTACRVADTCREFTDDELVRLRAHLTANMDAICTACGYCDACPQQIPIPSYMQFYNQHQMFETPEERMVKLVANEHVWGLLAGRQANADACVNCGLCEEACTQRLNITERLAKIAAWENSLQQG